MSTGADNLAPTARLRWVERRPPDDPVDGPASGGVRRVLQQWFAEPMPSYMRNQAKGEWRDVETGIEAP